MFDHIENYPGDPILSLVETFQHDPCQNKVNLGIGLYYDEAGRVPTLGAVHGARSQLADRPDDNTYLPMAGHPDFRRAVQRLLFGSDSAAVADGRIATIQTLGGSGALKVGADMLSRFFPESGVWVSNPTWDNHRAIFAGAGFVVRDYPYYDRACRELLFEPMMNALKRLAAQDIVVLHACCHNPTGADLSPSQWQEVIAVVKERQLIPFVDLAYQGFGESLDADAYAVRAMSDAGVHFFVANSFSKNLSLYGERCGGLSVACSSADEALRVFGQLQAAVRRNYSSPPRYGARLAATVLDDVALLAQWTSELDAMRERIQGMRQRLCLALSERLPSRDFSYLTRQRGMFSYTDLSSEQIDRLREKHSVYLVGSGRMCVTGLNTANVDYVADAIADVL